MAALLSLIDLGELHQTGVQFSSGGPLQRLFTLVQLCVQTSKFQNWDNEKSHNCCSGIQGNRPQGFGYFPSLPTGFFCDRVEKTWRNKLDHSPAMTIEKEVRNCVELLTSRLFHRLLRGRGKHVGGFKSAEGLERICKTTCGPRVRILQGFRNMVACIWEARH